MLCNIKSCINNAIYTFRFGYVCASKTMALRKLLEAETTDAGFTNEEKGRVKHKENSRALLPVTSLTGFLAYVYVFQILKNSSTSFSSSSGWNLF